MELSKIVIGGMRLDLCHPCGLFESCCPNGLPVRRIIAEARSAIRPQGKQPYE
jgi:hypothetical protein